MVSDPAFDHIVGNLVGEDARFVRTRARLTAAVLALAGERDITAASVSELTRRAGVNRTTFYAHADTPVALLTNILAADLDRVRKETTERLDEDGMLLRDLTRETMRQILDHVLRHENVYHSANLASSRYALRVVLADHVEQSILMVFQEGFLRPPPPEAAMVEFSAAFIAHGVAASVEAWFRRPAPRDEATLLAAIEAMYPAWYAPAARPAASPGQYFPIIEREKS
jgi:AcrR family transcriptional regulator